MKKTLAAVLLFMLFCCHASTAQVVTDVDFHQQNEIITVNYTISGQAHVTLFVSINDGDYISLPDATGDVGMVTEGNKSIRWNMMTNYPGGIEATMSFYVKTNYKEPSLSDLPSGFSRYSSVIAGTKIYDTSIKDRTSRYVGDERKGTAASAIDQVSWSCHLLEYDTVTAQTRDLGKVFGWSGRVARKNQHLFGEKEPDTKLKMTDGAIYVNGYKVKDL